MKITNEVKTGIIVVAAIATGVVFWVKTTDFSATPYRIKTSFTYADGIKQDSIVKLSGVDVGRIEKVEFTYEPETKVILTLVLDKKAKVREDSIAFIATAGMIGDAYVGITPGSKGESFITEGTEIRSEDPIQMRLLMKKADAIADNLDKTLTQVKSLIEDNRAKIDNTITNLEAATGGIAAVFKDNKSKIDNIAANLEVTTENFKEFSDDIKRNPWKLLMKK